jgi:CubicO group peptidase (beta-lactamase class C family)
MRGKRLIVLVVLLFGLILTGPGQARLSLETAPSPEKGQQDLNPTSVRNPLAFKGPRLYTGPEPLYDPEDTTDLDLYIEERLEEAHIPGLSAAIVKDGAIVWTGAYGWSRIRFKRPIEAETLFMLASVSKTVTATAVMQVWEDGGFDLDKDIDAYLPFEVTNPHHPEQPITPRMLLTHTSAIRDNWPVLNSLYVRGDSPIALGEFLEDYLTPGGAYYSPWANFYRQEPGTADHYSNVGVTLAAYLVEVITGIPFDSYCQEAIFEPLGMEETAWHLTGLNRRHIAMPYGYRPLGDIYHRYGFYGYPDYPDGALRTSVLQLARFLNAFIRYGELDGVRILEEETVEEMRRVQDPALAPNQGLVWYYKELSDRVLLGHNGGDSGVATEMFFRPEDGVGVILLMNGDWPVDMRPIMEIEIRLFEEADSL